MSLWQCSEHGLVGPGQCCGKATLARLEVPAQSARQVDGLSDSFSAIVHKDQRLLPSPRLYVLTHEITELEDYEKVPEEGTEILIAGDTTTRVAQLEEGLRDIVSMYNGFTNTKEMMQRARKALEPHSCPKCSPASGSGGA